MLSNSGKPNDTTPVHGIPLLTRRDLMNATKEAVKELLSEQATAFGWWSFKTLSVAGLGAFILFVLWINGYGKHG